MARAPRKGARSPDRACAFEPNSVDKNESERGRLNYRGRLIMDTMDTYIHIYIYICNSKVYCVAYGCKPQLRCFCDCDSCVQLPFRKTLTSNYQL